MLNVYLFGLLNLLMYFFMLFFMTVIHERGHYYILRAAGAKPKTTINILKGSKTVAMIPRARKDEIQAFSALNAILYGYFVFMTFILGLAIMNLEMFFLPAMAAAWVAYVIGVSKDIQNIKRYKKTNKEGVL